MRVFVASAVALCLAAIAVGCKSDSNNTPTTPATCTYTATPATQSVAAAGGTFTMTVTRSSGTCAWSAASNATFATLSTAGGSDTANVTVTVAANAATTARTATITVSFTGGTAQVTVNQAAATPPPAACTYTLAPTTQAAVAGGESLSATLTVSGSNCSWSAASDASWLTITSGGSGTATGTISYSVSANGDVDPRTGTITITHTTGTTRLTVNQAGIANCIYTMNPASQQASPSGGTYSVTPIRNTPNGCSWAASTSTSWITLNGPTSGASGVPISYTVAAIGGSGPRTGSISLIWSGGSLEFPVTQTVGCVYGVSPDNRDVTNAGGSFSVQITTSSPTCEWRAESDSSWLTITSGASNTGGAVVNYTVAANGTGAQRIGKINIIGSIVGTNFHTVTQQP